MIAAPTPPAKPAPVVLLMEHDQLTLHVLKGILTSRGCEVVVAQEVPDLELLMPLVDVVICAYDMPFVPVKDLLQTIKRNWPQKRVFLTSATSVDELTDGTHDQIDGFIPKPFEMDRLNAMIEQIAA